MAPNLIWNRSIKNKSAPLKGIPLVSKRLLLHIFLLSFYHKLPKYFIVILSSSLLKREYEVEWGKFGFSSKTDKNYFEELNTRLWEDAYLLDKWIVPLAPSSWFQISFPYSIPLIIAFWLEWSVVLNVLRVAVKWHNRITIIFKLLNTYCYLYHCSGDVGDRLF